MKANRHRDGRRVVMAGELPARDEAFILVGVASRGARGITAGFLAERGWAEGRDYLLAA